MSKEFISDVIKKQGRPLQETLLGVAPPPEIIHVPRDLAEIEEERLVTGNRRRTPEDLRGHEEQRAQARAEARRLAEKRALEELELDSLRAVARSERGEKRRERWVGENLETAEKAAILDGKFQDWSNRLPGVPSELVHRLKGQLDEVIVAAMFGRPSIRGEVPIVAHRRFEELVFDERGDAWALDEDGRYAEQGAIASEQQLGLAVLHQSDTWAKYQEFLRERYGSLSAGSSSRAALVEDALARLAGPESGDHVGIEAASRPRLQWLQNRLLYVFKIAGILRHTDIRMGCLQDTEDGQDLAFVEAVDPRNQDPRNLAVFFSDLALSPVSEWQESFRSLMPMSVDRPDAPSVKDLIAEMALVSVLMNDVGGEIDKDKGSVPYEISYDKGTLVYNNTGKVFSVAAEWLSELPSSLKKSMAKLPEQGAAVKGVLGYSSVPFELASTHKLELPNYAQSALAKMMESWWIKSSPNELSLGELVRSAFEVAFPNSLVATREYRAFVARLESFLVNTATRFEPTASGAIGSFARNLQPLLESGSLFSQVPDPALLRTSSIPPAHQSAA